MLQQPSRSAPHTPSAHLSMNPAARDQANVWCANRQQRFVGAAALPGIAAGRRLRGKMLSMRRRSSMRCCTSALSKPTGAPRKGVADNTIDDVGTIQRWYTQGSRIVIAITNKGLQGAVAREVLHRYGQDAANLHGRVCLRWNGEPQGPMLHGASRVVPLFALAFDDDLHHMRQSSDLYGALTQFVEVEAHRKIHSVLAPAQQEVLLGRPLRFTARCRVNCIGAERIAFGSAADWTRLKSAIREGVQKATGWELVPRSCDVEANVVAFLGADHLALGVEAPEGVPANGYASFPWSSVPRPGMETQLAGAMAALAAEAADPAGGGVIVDPACGMGTLLLAAARAWPRGGGRPLRLIGRDLDERQIERCCTNFVQCGLHVADVRVADSRSVDAFSDVEEGCVDAVICDLPCGAQYKASADAESYAYFLGLAARLLRRGGRCVLLSTRREMLARSIAPGPWQLLASWEVGRGEGNLREFQLVVLERAAR